MIIKKTDFSVDASKALEDLNFLLRNKIWWPEETVTSNKPQNQISLRHRANSTDNLWLDGIGSLVDRDTGNMFAKESDFTVWNQDLPEYTKQILEELMQREGVKFGRIRYMRLMPRTGLTVHMDKEQRYHLVLTTNKFAMVGHVYEGGEELGKLYHIPADNFFYKLDTTQGHFVFNGGKEERVHLVCCIAND
jgi:hypothetical protein